MIKPRSIGGAGLATRMWAKRNAYRILAGKPQGKRPLGRPRHRWVDNIKMDLRVIGWGGMDWIDLAQTNLFQGYHLLECEALKSIRYLPTFRLNVLRSYSELWNKSKKANR
jgi:hypothetical protein